jgi:hypothetical protein
MVRRYAVVRNNIVENVIVIEGDGSWYSVEGAEVIDVTDIFVGPGFTRNEDGTFSVPVVEDAAS